MRKIVDGYVVVNRRTGGVEAGPYVTPEEAAAWKASCPGPYWSAVLYVERLPDTISLPA